VCLCLSQPFTGDDRTDLSQLFDTTAGLRGGRASFRHSRSGFPIVDLRGEIARPHTVSFLNRHVRDAAVSCTRVTTRTRPLATRCC
jgi:hypothetical protein